MCLVHGANSRTSADPIRPMKGGHHRTLTPWLRSWRILVEPGNPDEVIGGRKSQPRVERK